jgi:hypothetical protein
MAAAELSWVRLYRRISYHRMIRHGAGTRFWSGIGNQPRGWCGRPYWGSGRE